MQTREIEDAIRLALSQRGGTIGGSRVEYTALDDSDEETGDWSRQKEIANATAAANDPNVIAYFGQYNSGAAMLAIPITNRAGLLEISTSATWPGLTESGWDPGEPLEYYPSGERNFFRLMPPDSKQADAAAQWAAGQGQTSVAVLDDGSSYSTGLANEFVTAAGALGISVTNRIHLKLDPGANLLSQVGPARTFFYAPSSVGFALTVARAIQSSHAVVYASDTALDPQFISQAGSAALDWKIVSNSAPPDSQGSFAASTKPGQTFPSQFAANAYDATSLVLDGIASGTATNRSELLKYMGTATETKSGTPARIFIDLGDPQTWVLSGYVVTPSGVKLDRTITGGSQAAQVGPTH